MKSLKIFGRVARQCGGKLLLRGLCAGALGLLSAMSASAATLAYEGFDYVAATPVAGLNGGIGFLAPWVADAGVVVQSVGLASPLSLPSIGLSAGGGFNAARQLISPLNEAEYWVSFEIEANPGNDQVYLGFDTGPSPTPLVSFGRILSTYFIRQSGSAAVTGGVASPPGATDFLVARFRQVGAFTIVDLWVNTIDFSLPPLISKAVPTVAYTWVNFQVQPGFLLDEVRIGTTPADVAAASPGYTVSGHNLTLTWPQGILLEAPTINGPWETNRAAASPYTVPMNSPQRFYRVISQ
jgi:hypothetical protein